MCSPPCLNGGRCIGFGRCLCANAYSGQLCENGLSDIDTIQCDHSGHFTIQSIVENFLTSPSTCPTSPLATANAPPVFFPFQLHAVRYGRAACQNHRVIYEAFAIVSLCGWASHSYLFRWAASFKYFRCSTVYTYCIVTGGKSGPQSAPCDLTTTPFWPDVPHQSLYLEKSPVTITTFNLKWHKYVCITIY